MKLIDNDYAKSESAYHHHDSRNEKYQIKYLYRYIHIENINGIWEICIGIPKDSTRIKLMTLPL